MHTLYSFVKGIKSFRKRILPLSFLQAAKCPFVKCFVLRFFLCGLMMMGVTVTIKAQIIGDFQTKSATGNWSDFNAWNIYNGASWIAATSGQIPAATSSVFVQAANNITVDITTAVCNNLNINGATTSKIAFSTVTSILNVKGNMGLFSIGHNCFGAWTAGAKIVFSGTGAQGFTNLSTNSVFISIEVNNPSCTLTTFSNFRFGSFTLTAGNFAVGSGSEIQGSSTSATITINGGKWTQINGATRINNSGTAGSPIGSLNINNGGIMILETSSTVIGGGFQFSTISVTTNGILTLNYMGVSGVLTIANSLNVDVTSVFNTAMTTTPIPSTHTLNGIVNYNHNAAQNIAAVAYSYLKISGSGTKTLAAGTTTIANNGTLEMSGVATSPTLALGGNSLSVSSTNTNLIYSSTGSQTATGTEWDANFKNVTINNAASVTMAASLSRTVKGTLTLTMGTLTIAGGGGLTLDGAMLVRTLGFLGGTSTSDFSVIGTTGGTVLLPLAGNISLRNITVGDTRTLQIDGTNHINLSGLLSITSGATYDNGGESQITNGGGSVTISGKFLNRDIDNFTGSNGAIPGIVPTLIAGCTIEYGLATGTGNQAVTTRADYRNIIFSGIGTKLLSGTFNPNGNVYVTGTAIADAVNHTFGNATTNLIMDGGRFRMSGASTKPDIDGTYTLTGGVIEFYSSQATRQTIKGKNGVSTDIIYNQIEVTGSNVGQSSSDIMVNEAGGKFTVKNTPTIGNFYMSNRSIKSNATINTTSMLMESGTTFITTSSKGFSGFSTSFTDNSSIHSNISTITLHTGSTVDYAGASDLVQLISNQIPYQNLVLSAPAGFTKTPLLGSTLTILGHLTKTGAASFAHNGGTVLFSGSSAQSYGVNNTMALPIMTFYNVTNSNNTGFTINDSLAVVKQLLLSDGSKLSLGTGDIILKSSDTITANVAPIGTGIISYPGVGRFVVERYINTGISHLKSWQFLSVPTDGQTIKAAWQEGGSAGNNPKPGYGTQLTSPLGIAAGYDVTSSGTSIKTYISTIDKWDTGPTNTNNFIANPKGYMLFVRGNRMVASGSGAAPTILRTRGTVFKGTQPSIPVPANLYESIGNPYASAIDLRNVTKANLFNEIYIWDPTLGGSYGVGGYRTLTLLKNGNYQVVPTGGIYPGPYVDTIQSGQAFFVKSNNIGSSWVQFSETAKVSAGSRLVNSPARGGFEKKPELLSVNLSLVKPFENNELLDGAIVIFGSHYSDKVDIQVGAKLINAGENTGFMREGKLLTVERRPSPQAHDTLNLNLTGTKPRAYNWTLNLQKMNVPGRVAYLFDKYQDTKTTLHLIGITSVDFAVDNNPASSAADRFKIVFGKKPPLPALPVEPPVFISVYPNPVVGKKIMVQFSSQPLGNYSLKLTNKLGQSIYRGGVSVSSSNFLKIIKLAPNTATGNYQLSITAADGSKTVQQVVVL